MRTVFFFVCVYVCLCEYLSESDNDFVRGVPDHIIAIMLLQCRLLWRLDHLTMEVLRWTVEFRGTITAGLY